MNRDEHSSGNEARGGVIARSMATTSNEVDARMSKRERPITFGRVNNPFEAILLSPYLGARSPFIGGGGTQWDCGTPADLMRKAEERNLERGPGAVIWSSLVARRQILDEPLEPWLEAIFRSNLILMQDCNAGVELLQTWRGRLWTVCSSRNGDGPVREGTWLRPWNGIADLPLPLQGEHWLACRAQSLQSDEFVFIQALSKEGGTIPQIWMPWSEVQVFEEALACQQNDRLESEIRRAWRLAQDGWSLRLELALRRIGRLVANPEPVEDSRLSWWTRVSLAATRAVVVRLGVRIYWSVRSWTVESAIGGYWSLFHLGWEMWSLLADSIWNYVLWPPRKLFWFSRYQWNKRIRGRI